MTKIITSDETDIELDPESLTDINTPLSLNAQDKKAKRLEAIRDLESLLDNTENVLKNDTFSIPKKENKKEVECIIRFESKQSKNSYATKTSLISLNQTIIDRHITEIELAGEEQKLIGLFTFYQNNIYRQKRVRKINGSVKVLLQKKRTFRKKRRKNITKNDVVLTKFDIIVNNKKFNLFDINQYYWKVNEVKYTFDNNKSTIKILLVKGNN